MFRRDFYRRPQVLQNPTTDAWKAMEANASETAKTIYQFIRRLIADDVICWLVVETCFPCTCVVTSKKYVSCLWNQWFSLVGRIHVLEHVARWWLKRNCG